MIKIKRNTKLTKINEMEAEIKAFTDENIRLRNLLKSSMGFDKSNLRSLEDKYYKLLTEKSDLE